MQNSVDNKQLAELENKDIIGINMLSNAMKDDPDYAEKWHDNLAMMAVDAGADKHEANEYASSFMWNVFGVKTGKRKLMAKWVINEGSKPPYNDWTQVEVEYNDGERDTGCIEDFCWWIWPDSPINVQQIRYWRLLD